MSRIDSFKNRREFESAFLPEWRRMELSETAEAFSGVKHEYDQKIAGFAFKYPVGTSKDIFPPRSHIGLKTVCWFG